MILRTSTLYYARMFLILKYSCESDSIEIKQRTKYNSSLLIEIKISLTRVESHKNPPNSKEIEEIVIFLEVPVYNLKISRTSCFCSQIVYEDNLYNPRAFIKVT